MKYVFRFCIYILDFLRIISGIREFREFNVLLSLPWSESTLIIRKHKVHKQTHEPLVAVMSLSNIKDLTYGFIGMEWNDLVTFQLKFQSLTFELQHQTSRIQLPDFSLRFSTFNELDVQLSTCVWVPWNLILSE